MLTVTTDQHRMQSMMEALRKLRVSQSPGARLFFFTTRDELRATDPLMHEWNDGKPVPAYGYDVSSSGRITRIVDCNSFETVFHAAYADWLSRFARLTLGPDLPQIALPKLDVK